MAYELKQQLKLSQQLIMTPQLQQAIKLLQLSRLELSDLLQQEINENPVLDENIEDSEKDRELDEDASFKDREATDALPEITGKTEFDWKDYVDKSVMSKTVSFGSEDKDDFEPIITKKTSLKDHLIWQLHLHNFTQKEFNIAEYIIMNLNSEGYFQLSLEEIANEFGFPLSEVKTLAEKVDNVYKQFTVRLKEIASEFHLDLNIINELSENVQDKLFDLDDFAKRKNLNLSLSKKIAETVEFEVKRLEIALKEIVSNEVANKHSSDLSRVTILAEKIHAECERFEIDLDKSANEFNGDITLVGKLKSKLSERMKKEVLLEVTGFDSEKFADEYNVDLSLVKSLAEKVYIRIRQLDVKEIANESGVDLSLVEKLAKDVNNKVRPFDFNEIANEFNLNLSLVENLAEKVHAEVKRLEITLEEIARDFHVDLNQVKKLARKKMLTEKLHAEVKRFDFDEIALENSVNIALVEKIHNKVKRFDPLGIAARSLQECLLTQAEILPADHSLIEKILLQHMSNLEARKYQLIAKDLKVPLEDVIEACHIISNMETQPGRSFSDNETQYITPDIYVYKMNDDWVVVLNEDGQPKLRINPYYKKALSDPGMLPTKTRDYIQDKFRSAVWLIKSIYHRQGTIMNVMKSIIKFQRDFFDHGVGHLKPLVLRDVAEDIGMHESNISRVTTNKYVYTPHGVFELKYFFNSGLTSDSGESIASESVKNIIKEILQNENSRKPLSDQDIADMLKAQGINIARRTVTKYREVLGVLSSSKRKKYF